MKLFTKALVYVVLMNAVLMIGAVAFDADFEFNFIFNLNQSNTISMQYIDH